MRAWQYYHLVRMYGNLPWIDKALNINDEGEIYGNREDRDMVMDKVLEDLDFAVTNIKDISSKTTWSRSLANAMKAEVCLYEGTFRKYRKNSSSHIIRMSFADRFGTSVLYKFEYRLSQSHENGILYILRPADNTLRKNGLCAGQN